MLGGIATMAILITAALPAAAGAADLCVGVARDACQPRETLAAAVADAKASIGVDRVFVGPGEHEVPMAADSIGDPLEIHGSSRETTRLVAADGSETTLRLADPASWVSGVELLAPADPGLVTLELAGTARSLTIGARDAAGSFAADVRGGGLLTDAVVHGRLRVTAPARVERITQRTSRGPAITAVATVGQGEPVAPVVLESLDVFVDHGSEPALSTACRVDGDARVVARHLTVTGTALAAAAAVCEHPGRTALLDVALSILRGDFGNGTFASTGQAVIATRRSDYVPDPDVDTSFEDVDVDPGFISATDHRLAPGSPLIDLGGALEAGQGFWDAGGLPRAADGDGDVAAERDVGAHERQPDASQLPEGNVLVNPGAEQSVAIDTTGEGAEPFGWTRTGSFTSVAYGTFARLAGGALIELPTRATGEALAAGNAFFAAGTSAESTLLQRIDVQASAREIDTGNASASVSGLIGGYGADEDRVVLEAVFRDPSGAAISRLSAPGVTPAERGNATNLLLRTTAGAIPPRTRAIDVTVSAQRVGGPGESYTDAYADQLALVLSVPGIPVEGPVSPTDPPVQGLRPFAGITILTGRPAVSTKRKAKLRLACASGTVGSCAGTLELRAQLRRGTGAVRIARFGRFSVGPGRQGTTTLQLTMASWRALRGKTSVRATLFAVVRDGQGLERKVTVPLRLRLPKSTRR